MPLTPVGGMSRDTRRHGFAPGPKRPCRPRAPWGGGVACDGRAELARRVLLSVGYTIRYSEHEAVWGESAARAVCPDGLKMKMAILYQCFQANAPTAALAS